MAYIHVMNNQQVFLTARGSVIKSAQYEEYLQAGDIIASAGKIAQNIINNTQKIEEEAKERGFTEGKKNANTELAQEHLKLMQKNTEYLNESQPMLEKIIDQSLRYILKQYPPQELLKQSLERAIADNSFMKNIKIRISPSQLDMVQEALPNIVRQSRFAGITQVESDANLSETDCILETPLGIVDLTIENQLFQILKILTEK